MLDRPLARGSQGYTHCLVEGSMSSQNVPAQTSTNEAAGSVGHGH